MVKRVPPYNVPDDTIREAMLLGATHYRNDTFSSVFMVYRPYFSRRFWILGRRKHTGWDVLTFGATPGFGPGGIVWVQINNWERCPFRSTPSAGSMFNLHEALESNQHATN